MSQKEPLSRPVLITGVVVPLAIGAMAIAGNILTTRLQPTSPTAANVSSDPVAPLPQGGTENSPAVVDKEDGEGGRDVTVKVGATANVFSGKVFIAVTQIRTEGGSARNTVYVTLSSDESGVKDKGLERVDAGYSYSYNGSKIRVMSVETDHASFRVTPLSSSASPDPTSGPRH